MYPVLAGVCWFCGKSGLRVIGSEDYEEETPPAICEDCADEALAMFNRRELD